MNPSCVRMQSSWEMRVSSGTLILYSALFSKRLSIKLGQDASSQQADQIVARARALQLPTARRVAIDCLQGLAGSSAEVAGALLERLVEAGAIIAADCAEVSAPQDRAYDRLGRFLTSFESPAFSGADSLERLQSSSVLLVGLGSYGSFIANCLVRLGIRRLVAFDHDEVEVSNLDRQILYQHSDVGSPKVQAAAQSLGKVGGDTVLEFYPLQIKEPAHLHEALATCDLAVNTFGFEKESPAGAPASRIINDACIKLRKPCLNLGGSWCGPFYLPGKTPCYFCAYEMVGAEWGVDPTERSPFVQKRMFYPMVEMTSSMGEFDIVGHLSGAWHPRTCGKIIKVNWWGEKAFSERDVAVSPDCRCRSARQ
jgi:hypothetical protein